MYLHLSESGAIRCLEVRRVITRVGGAAIYLSIRDGAGLLALSIDEARWLAATLPAALAAAQYPVLYPEFAAQPDGTRLWASSFPKGNVGAPGPWRDGYVLGDAADAG